MTSPSALRISDPDPHGDATLVPAVIGGRSEIRLAREMAQSLVASDPDAASQALQQLHAMFPDSPLTIRIAALNALMRR